jgi:hypothetical protein
MLTSRFIERVTVRGGDAAGVKGERREGIERWIWISRIVV